MINSVVFSYFEFPLFIPYLSLLSQCTRVFLLRRRRMLVHFVICTSNSSPIIDVLLLSNFSRVRLCETPQTEAHQAPPSVGFSRQEHWSGLPFPSPMHESEVKGKSLSHFLLLATLWTAAYQAPPSMGFSRQEYWCGLPLPSLPSVLYT